MLFFYVALQVHRKIREDSDMAQDSLQCLAQLASMHGPIFPDESAQVSYLAHLVEGLLSMINGSVALWLLWCEAVGGGSDVEDKRNRCFSSSDLLFPSRRD